MIRIEGLRKHFAGHAVLDGIDLHIPAGQRIALIGANGAGKTTLIRCLLGEYHHEGVLLVDGRAPRAARTEVLSRMAFVPQLPPPLRMSVGELIAYVCKVCTASGSEIERLAARLGLDTREIAARPFVKLSGGQKQKLLVALALGRKADVLILDEPAANLDPAARAALFDLMSDRPDATMLISSHRLDEVAGLVNRVIELDHGRVSLDNLVVTAMDIGKRLHCRIELAHNEPAFARTASQWQLVPTQDETCWTGTIPAPDRLRFLGFLARYSALITAIHMQDNGQQGIKAGDGRAMEEQDHASQPS